MFKKTLLALAMAGVAGTATAGSITATDVNVSVEGFASQAAAAQIITTTDVADITIDLDADLITNDVLEVTFQGATIDTASVPVLTLDAGGVPDAASLQFLDIKDDSTLRFRVTADVAAVTGVEADDDDDAVLSGVTLDPTSAADGAEITVTSKAISSSAAIGEYEIVSTPVAVATFRDQLEVTSVTKLDATVDVGDSRLTFTGNTTSDDLVVSLTDNTADVDALTLTSVTHTIMASDFGYLMAYDETANGGDADGELDAGELSAAITVAAGAPGTDDTFALDLDMATNTLTIEQTIVGGDLDLATATFNISGDVAISEQDFTAGIVGTDGTDTATAAAAGTDVGAWSLNGSVFHVPTFYSNAKHASLVMAANRGNLDADVELIMYVDGEAMSQGVVGTVGKYSQLDLTAAVKAGAAAVGVSAGYSFDLVFEGSNNNIDISAQYVSKTNGSRAVVQVTEL